MGTVFTAFEFENSIENGGEAVKLEFIRVKSNKISQKRRFGDETQADGSVRRVIERKNGDPWLVDWCVTDSSCGTDSNTKFPLLYCFRETICTILSDLVGVGGKYEGYMPIIQGYNAGPHEDAEFKKFVRGNCGSKGWYWEPQDPEIPYTNVLDMPIFQVMSRHQIKRARASGGLGVLREDNIW